MQKLKAIVKKNPLFRVISIGTMNILFCSKTIKSWFEKNIFNPYEIDGNKSADYALMQMNVISTYLDVSGKTILEIGPGGNYYLACLLLRHGAKKVFVIDNENHSFFSNQEIAIYKKLYPQSISDDKTINQDKITVLRYSQHDTIPLSDNCIDIVYSNAVLEHVFSPMKLLLECQRILTAEGKMMHQIDYRDHVFDQQSLFFLRVPNLLFDILFKNTGMWVNRLRHSEWIILFQSLKSTKVITVEKKQENIASRPFGKYSNEDIDTTSALFILEKHTDKMGLAGL